MNQGYADLVAKLRNGLFLSSMMGITDGAYCAQRSKGCAMVQLGAYLAEPTASTEERGGYVRSFLPADAQSCTAFLARECEKAAACSAVLTCLNLATPRLEWGLEAAQCFAQAGGDILELNAHGGYQRYLQQGKLRAMVLPENQGELFRWIEAFAELDIPLVVKFNAQSDRPYVLQVLDEMADLSVFGVHINVRSNATQRPDLGLVPDIRKRYPGFFLVSGYVRSGADARALFEAGADMVGIADPTRSDAEYIYRIAVSLQDE